MQVPFFRHNINEDDIARLNQVLRSPFLTTGPLTREFEQNLAEYLGVKHAVGVNNGTMALLIGLKALGVEPGHEVITTPMSFMCSGNVVLQAGAKPVFVDVDPITGNMDLDLVAKAITPATKVIMPVHLNGQMVDMPRLRALADQHGVFILEDAAHALEAAYQGFRPGILGHAACFSFYATKNITCGEGGALAVNDDELKNRLHAYRLHGMSKGAEDRYHAKHYQHYDMNYLGYKCNMPDLSAALLIGQLARVEDNWKRREAICRRYEEAFAQIAGVNFPQTIAGSKSGRHMFTIWVDKRDEFMWQLQDRGIGVAVHYRPIHLMAWYRQHMGGKPGQYPRAEKIGSRTITLPLYPGLNEAEVSYVIESVQAVAAEQAAK